MIQKRMQIKNLGVSFQIGSKLGEAVRGLNLDLRPGEIRGIVGESGCGKTVTAKSILRLHDERIAQYSGEIIYKDKNILQMNKKELEELRGSEIAYIFQNPMSAFDNLYTIGQQIDEMLIKHKVCKKKEARKRTHELLQSVGVTPPEKRANQYPYEFSGGMLQRAMIAMMIAANPEILIADEVTTALDVTMQKRVLELLRSIRDKENISILCITHDFGVVAEICDSVTVMYGGFVVECGLTEEIFYAPKHPYTEHLIRNLQHGYELSGIVMKEKSSPYDIMAKQEGCVYQARCPYATNKCRFTAPPVLGDYEGHGYVCHYTPESPERRKQEVGDVSA